jgi:YD repeat-containing protein
VTTSITYDAYARPATSTSPHGAVTTYSYTNSPPTTTATVNGRWTRTTTDGFGRTIKVEAGQTNPAVTVSVVDTEYTPCACSPLGKVKRVSEPHTPFGAVHWTTYNYDPMGRTTSVV